MGGGGLLSTVPCREVVVSVSCHSVARLRGTTCGNIPFPPVDRQAQVSQGSQQGGGGVQTRSVFVIQAPHSHVTFQLFLDDF